MDLDSMSPMGSKYNPINNRDTYTRWKEEQDNEDRKVEEELICGDSTEGNDSKQECNPAQRDSKALREVQKDEDDKR